MTIEDLSARLEKVERANRRLKAVGIAALVLAAAGVAMGQAAPPPKVIQAERFEVLGGDGKVRIALGESPTGPGWIGLRLLDSAGKRRVGLGMDPDGAPSLAMQDGTGKNRAVYAVTEEEGPMLRFTDREGTLRADLRVGRDGSPGLYLSGHDGDIRAAIAMSKDDSAAVAICERGKPWAVLGVSSIDSGATGKSEKTSPSSLVLFDKDGKVIERLPR